MQRWAKHLPPQKQKEDEEQNTIANNAVTTNHIEVDENAENKPDQHEDPVAQS
jgi:hypothetical protein